MDLDDAYANAAHIPGGIAYPARWADAAATFRAALGPRAECDLSYGDGARQAFDLFHPEGPTQGTVLFIHGGFWRAFDKSTWSHLAAGPLARGWAVAMPSYDLCPQVRIADITRQMAAALTAIATRTDGPISLAGHSAGGHLVSRLLDPALTPTAIAGRLHHVVPISPLSDLRPLMRTTMNDDFRLTEAEAIAESPLTMTDRHPVPVTVWVGGAERPAFLDQARWLSERWGVEQVIAPERHHFDVIDPLADLQSALVDRLTT